MNGSDDDVQSQKWKIMNGEQRAELLDGGSVSSLFKLEQEIPKRKLIQQ